MLEGFIHVTYWHLSFSLSGPKFYQAFVKVNSPQGLVPKTWRYKVGFTEVIFHACTYIMAGQPTPM